MVLLENRYLVTKLSFLDENSHPVKQGEIGELRVKGPSSALKYWRNVEKTKKTFIGEYTVSGDKYYLDEDGFYVYAGRADDMLKVSGQYVSPFEVERPLFLIMTLLKLQLLVEKTMLVW